MTHFLKIEMHYLHTEIEMRYECTTVLRKYGLGWEGNVLSLPDSDENM